MSVDGSTADQPKSEATPRPKLDLDVDLLPEQTSDDLDSSWGGGASEADDPAARLRRYLAETPPHHGD